MDNVTLAGEDALGEDEDAPDEGVVGGREADLDVRLQTKVQ